MRCGGPQISSLGGPAIRGDTIPAGNFAADSLLMQQTLHRGVNPGLRHQECMPAYAAS
jgi:hypothetical protein